jgi:hypothetical protein
MSFESERNEMKDVMARTIKVKDIRQKKKIRSAKKTPMSFMLLSSTQFETFYDQNIFFSFCNIFAISFRLLIFAWSNKIN